MSAKSRGQGANGQRTIERLDYPSGAAAGEQAPLLEDSEIIETPWQDRQGHSHESGYFFDRLAQGVQDKERVKFQRELTRYVSFAWAITSCLCAGSITAFSLYAPLFQTRLHYSQYNINVIAIVAEVSLYLPVPLLGFVCDRYGPRPMSILSGTVFGLGYFLAAFTYRSGPPHLGGWPIGIMILSFVGIGMGTCSMYLAGVTTCAKNFGRGKHKGFALAAPIASFGLSGMWQSQIGSRLLYERSSDGSKGELDVFRYFLFLGGLLLGVGLIGSVLLRIVDENELIDEAVEELERSGLLQESEFFHPRSYGTMAGDSTPEEEEQKRLEEEEEARKKSWLLWSETKRFLSDHTMWWLAAGFLVVTGAGETFINNLGTILGTLSSPDDDPRLVKTTPATHVSIVAITSTLARLLSGTLSDLISPAVGRHSHRRDPASLSSSLASLDPLTESRSLRKFELSRLPLLLGSTILLSIGFVLLASGAVQGHAADRFWLVSALVGTGYGAVFSLVPIIISCVWGIENFGTNWGIVAVVPAFGSAIWGIAYAAVYDRHSGREDGRCFGLQCYASTFWAAAGGVWVACILWFIAWRGPKGWTARRVAV